MSDLKHSFRLVLKLTSFILSGCHKPIRNWYRLSWIRRLLAIFSLPGNQKRFFEDDAVFILSLSGRTWPFCILAVLFHVSIISLFLWKQKGSTLLQVEQVGHPIEIVYLEDKPVLPVSILAKEEKIPEKKEKEPLQPIFQAQTKDDKAKAVATLPSATETKVILSLKTGNSHPSYPEYARENGIEGKVIAVLKIEASTGGVREVNIAEPRAHSCLEKSVVDTVMNWRFHPVNSSELIEETFPFEFRLTDDG